MKLNTAKATGEDEILNETCEFMNAETRQKMKELMKWVWKGKRTPQEWKAGTITPLYLKKKQEGGRKLQKSDTAHYQI